MRRAKALNFTEYLEKPFQPIIPEMNALYGICVLNIACHLLIPE